ncbi:MAG: NAD(+) synthase [Gammaproteobacteria bacterium]|nr:NAD(+) synthase [Gammaproteobacteria bacterium]
MLADMTDFSDLGFVKVALVAPPVVIADPAANAQAILNAYADAPDDAAIVLQPELGITGYTCEDLFATADLRKAAHSALAEVARATDERVLLVGTPWWLADGRILNCAFACRGGHVLGAVPKIAQPNYEEFYEKRWFASGAGIAIEVDDEALGRFPLRTDLVFKLGNTAFGIEICEDLWAPNPPSADLALAGAEIVLNLSASTELVAKADYRRDLVRTQSARTIAAYVYAGAGPTESTKDVVFGGHLIVAENGWLLRESARFELAGSSLTAEVDTQRLRHARVQNTTFAQSRRPSPAPVIDAGVPPTLDRIARSYPRQPFVPADESELTARAREILAIQATGLARRVRAAKAERLVIGLSGGLDSSLAYLVCLDVLELLNLPPTALCALTMPGPGTTAHTLASARELARTTEVELREIPIESAVDQHLADISHPGDADVTFENVQARERTQILFDTANLMGGIVVGTGDLSELALGWCTFNADQMASYNVNAGVPKTLIAYLVRWYARHRADDDLRTLLERVLDTPITPELIPSEDGEIGQETEAIIGPYELHDFFLYHFLRNGAGAAKIFVLACRAFDGSYTPHEIKHWLRVFFARFFAQQFKRTTLPPGPKVGTVSLSPRGDWRMPDEASAGALLAAIDEIELD